ncbi:MAG TPA: 50S ribosomal protein L11 methyltransferase [Bacteroidota bacterium]|nr:50S ribosomal protein L11 methyltransferase [Bacteroidota bacterium]
MKTYLELCITANPGLQELLLPVLLELGCDRFMNTDSTLFCYTTKDQWTPEAARRLEQECRRVLGTSSDYSRITCREIPEENWNAQWEKTIQPVTVGKRFIITPSWHPVPDDHDRIVIQIDPKMSFGTGYHETTRLVLQLLEHMNLKGKSVLDVGTGTGILAIASAKLGAARVVGTDIDEWAISNSRENIIANRVTTVVEITDRELKTFPVSTFDVIVSNITLNSHIEMLDSYRSILKSPGRLLLSGLLVSDAPSMREQLIRRNFTVDRELNEHEWAAISARKDL